jgi:hypothetical protein
MRDLLFGVFVLVGPMLGLACYVLGPVGAVGASLIRVNPWWASPVVGLVLIPLLTLLFTPVEAFKGSPLPMPLPWLLALIVDEKSATAQELKEHALILAQVYGASLLVVLSYRGLASAISQLRKARSAPGERGG